MTSSKLLTFILFLSLLSCSLSREIVFTIPPEVVANPNPAVPLSAYLNLETGNDLQSISITLKSEDETREIIYQWTEKTKLGFPLYFFHPAKKYQIQLALTDKKGKTHPYREILEWEAPALPTDPMEFPKIILTKQESSKMAGGYTLINPRRRVPINLPGANEMNKSFGMLLIVDPNGEVLWYYRTNSRISDFDLLPNGAISYMTQDSRLIIIDWMGNIQKSWYAENRPEGKLKDAIPVKALTFHHDASFLPNGNIVVLSSVYKEIPNYFTSDKDENAPRSTQKVMGDIILEFDQEGNVIWEWKAFDVMDPFRIGYETFSRYWERRGFPGVIDWSHANTILFDEKNDAYIINFRYQSALLSIDRQTKNINWVFGEPTGWSEELSKKLIHIENQSDWFWHQHSPSFTSNGNLLIFDNANYKTRPFDQPTPRSKTRSRVFEYSINPDRLSARKVWSTLEDQKEMVVSVAMGDVDHLSNGNVLAAFGALVNQQQLEQERDGIANPVRGPQWTMVREILHTNPAKVIWELRLVPKGKNSKVGWTIFGAERVENEKWRMENGK